MSISARKSVQHKLTLCKTCLVAGLMSTITIMPADRRLLRDTTWLPRLRAWKASLLGHGPTLHSCLTVCKIEYVQHRFNNILKT
jgi:hypothetical protein